MPKALTNEQVAIRVTRGTTDSKDTVKVLYNDGKTALVKWPGGMVGRFGGSWCSAWVTMYDLTGHMSHSTGQQVWDCSCDKGGDGKLTKKRLKELVIKLGLDPNHIVEQPKKPKASQKPRVLPKKERRFQLEPCAVQVSYYVKGEGLPKDWEARLTVANIVAEVSTNNLCDSKYVNLEYENTMDMREFLRGDREKILDMLEE